ncbi:MAG: DUF6580 family putative transport protein [Chitinophagales bacterium]
MKSTILNSKFILLSVMILVAALSRLLTNQLHLWNFTPIAAIALFGAAHFTDKKFAFLIPMLAMLITDWIIGFHPGMWDVYATLVLITFIGFTLRNNVKVVPVIGVSLISSLLFFTITNFAVWAGSTLYPHTWEGLTTCIEAGIPFFGNTVAGDLFYCGVLFGGYELIRKYYPQMARTV